MMKRFVRAAAVFSALLCLAGCAPVNESENVSDGETIVYITPKQTQTAYEHKEPSGGGNSDGGNSGGEAYGGYDPGGASGENALPFAGYGGKYVYMSLSEDEKKQYDILLEAARSFEREAVFTRSLSDDELKKIFTSVYMQESRVFWLDSRYYSCGENPSVSLFYRYSREESEVMRAQLDIAAGRIIGSLPEGCSGYEAIKIFHDAVVLSSSFSKDGEYAHTAYGALVGKSAQCEGYAFAMAYLCNMAGIDNYVVSGTTSEGALHAWNKVCIDGEWYNVDCTWDDPILNRDAPDYVKHEYMLVPDRDIEGITHFPDSYIEHIPCTTDRQNFFITENLCFEDAGSGISSLKDQLYHAALAGKTEAEVRFYSNEAYEEASRRLFEKKGFKELIEDLNGNYGFKIGSANYSKNDPMRVIHISLIF